MKKAKYYIIAVAGMALFAFGLCLVKGVTEPQGLMKTAPYLCIGIGCGMFGHGMGDILAKKARQKDPKMAKQLDIQMNDERNVMHANESKAKGFEMMTYVFAALLLAYGLMGAAFEILIPFVCAYLFVQFYALYHRLKLDKEQ